MVLCSECFFLSAEVSTYGLCDGRSAWIAFFIKLNTMERQIAANMAMYIQERLRPFCDRIMIAGSIRRRKEHVKDIELVCIPKKEPVKDLFENITGYQVIPDFIKIVNEYKKIKGEPTGKYTQRLLRLQQEGSGRIYECNLDLFMVTPENWGLLFMIRTGSADFSKKMMNVARSEGYLVEDGQLWRGKSIVEVREEEDLFRILNRRWVEPWERY